MKITIEDAKRINPDLNPKLFLPSPRHVWEALQKPPISEWHKFIAEEYEIPRRVNYLIIVPCSAYKPYTPPRDKLYQCIHSVRNLLSNDAYFITISVPLAVEPEEFWQFKWRGYNLIYDAPFFPWIEKFGYKWEGDLADKILKRIDEVFSAFWERNRRKFSKSIAFIVPSFLDRKIVEGKVDHIVPDKDPPVEPSYENNASELHCHPESWNSFIDALKSLTGRTLDHLKV